MNSVGQRFALFGLIVSLYAVNIVGAFHRVYVHTEEERGVEAVGDPYPIFKGDESVICTRQNHLGTALFEQPFQFADDAHRDFFFLDITALSARIGAAMAGIQNNDCAWRNVE